LHASTHAAPQVSPPQALSLQALQQLLRQPLDVYYRHRLQLRMLQPDDAPEEHEPFELNGLQNYQLTLSLVAQGRTDDLRFLQGQGLLPLAGFAAAPLKRLQKQADELLKRSGARLQADASWQALPAQSVAIDLSNLGKLEGTLAGTGWHVNAQGDVLHLDLRPGAVSMESGAPKLNTLIHLWVTHLAACAQGLAVTSAMLGLDQEWQFAPLSAAQAQAELAHLVRCYHQAWQAPMCLPGKTAATWWAVYQHRLSSPKAKTVDVPTEALTAAHEAARAVFESSSFSAVTGEREAHAMLRRHFADYEAAVAQMPALSEALYGPMYKAAHKPGAST
jgi:exodeoxyribonuclease V gamma subunit